MKPLNLDSDAERLGAFVDGELDLPSQLAMEAQAEQDEALRTRTTNSLADRLRGFLGWRPMATVLAGVLVLGVAINVAWLQSFDASRTADEVVTSHVRATLGQRLVDVESSDHHTVKPWLSSRLDYSPPVVELKGPGASFLGGRIDYVDGRPVAALVYRQGQHVVTSFLWPASGGASEPRFSRQRGFETAHWVAGDMDHWVVSDLNPTEFRNVVAEIRQLEAGR